jgi:hypothetical protein
MGRTGGEGGVGYGIADSGGLSTLRGIVFQPLGVETLRGRIRRSIMEHGGPLEVCHVATTLGATLGLTALAAATHRAVTVTTATGLTGDYRVQITERTVQGSRLGLHAAGRIDQVGITLGDGCHAALLGELRAVEEGLGGAGSTSTLGATVAAARRTTVATTTLMLRGTTVAAARRTTMTGHFYSVSRLFTGSSGLSLITTGRPLRWRRRASVMSAFDRGPWRSNIWDASR